MVCSRRLLFAIDGLTAILGLAGFAYAIAVLVQNGTLCGDCVTIPLTWAYAVLGLTGGVVLVSLLGIVAVKKHWKRTLMFLIVLTLLTFALTILGTTSILLFSQNQGSGLSSAVDELALEFSHSMATWGVANPVKWIALQTQLQCCGVNLREAYSYPGEANRMATLDTGPLCNTTQEALISAIQVTLFPTYSDAAETYIDKQPGFSNPPYFCEPQAKAVVAKYTAQIGGAAGFFCVLQGMSIFLTILVLCAVKEEDGGFAETDAEGNIKQPAAIRAIENRMSMAVPQSAKQFTNRVSMRVFQAPVFGGGGSQTYPESPNGMHGFGSAPPPPGLPPPGLGGASGSGNPFMRPVQKPAAPSLPAPNSGGGGGAQDFGAEYTKYAKMKKSGLPEGAVRQAMQRDGVECPDGFFDVFEDAAPIIPHAVQEGFRNIANRVSMNVQRVSKQANRMSMNVRGRLAGGGFAPPPPPPGFGQLPPDGGGFGGGVSPGFGMATQNPSFRNDFEVPPPARNMPPPPMMMASPPRQQQQQQQPPPPPPSQPKTQPPPPPAGKKAAPPPKAAKGKPPPPAGGAKPGPPKGKAAKVGAPAAAPNALLGEIGAGARLKKTVTNDRSSPNFNA